MTRFKDYTDEQFGHLTALNLADPARFKGKTYWTFRCDCGNTIDKPIDGVIRGKGQHCGCQLDRNRDYSGQTFNMLTAVSIVKPIKVTKSGTLWNFRCKCGESIERPANQVVRGRVRSCGCLRSLTSSIQGRINSRKNFKLSAEQFEQIMAEIKGGKSQKDVAKEWGISPGTIFNYRYRGNLNFKQIIKDRLGSFLVKRRKYHSILSDELNYWYCYTTDGGHSILSLLFKDIESTNPNKMLVPVPVKTVLRDYILHNDYIVVDLNYDNKMGVIFPQEDEEF